jgi:hypothetical protein
MTLEEINRDDAQVLRLDGLRGGVGNSNIKFVRTSTNDIMSTKFDPIKWVVPGYISEGFLVLAGRQKLGKTWLAIDMALSVATGGTAIGSITCEQGDVLYIDMENGPRRIQGRINTLYPDERNRPDLSRLEWVTEAPQLGAGFIEELERWRISVPAPRLIVIDVLQRIKPPGSMARNAYENDYSTWAPLQHWATEHGIAVLGLHHTKKGGADDPLEALSGSNGLSACADTTLVLDSDQNGKTLYVRGRDVEEKETALIFAGGFWSILGEAADVRRSGERNKIIAALTDHGEPMTPLEVSAATRMSGNNVRQLLLKMARASEVYKAGKGHYWLEPSNPHNNDNAGNRRHETSDLSGSDDDLDVTDPENDDNADDAPYATVDGKRVSYREAADLLRAQFTPEELAGVDEGPITGTDNAGTKFDARSYSGPEGEVSRRRKCSHCHEQGGETVKVWHGLVAPWLHRECIDPWIADYNERFPEEDRQ